MKNSFNDHTVKKLIKERRIDKNDKKTEALEPIKNVLWTNELKCNIFGCKRK